jgi:hypothetical protein
MDFDALTVAATGIQVVAGATSATVAIPNTADGNKARYVRVQSSATAYIKPVVGGASTCSVNDILLTPSNDLRLSVHQFTHIAYLQETASAKINITPVEF